MRKVIASLVSISVVLLSVVPAQAQNAPQTVARGWKAISAGVEKSAVTTLRLPKNIGASVSSAPRYGAVKATASGVNARPVAAQTPAVKPLDVPTAPALSAETLKNVKVGVQRAAFLAQNGETLNYAQIRERVAQGNTRHLAARILTYPNEAVRQGMLRNEFIQTALAGNAAEAQVNTAVQFWREDIKTNLEAFSKLPKEAASFKQENETVRACNAVLADAAALGLFGSADDAALFADVYAAAKDTPFANAAAATAARGLLRQGAYKELETLSAQTTGQGQLFDGISSYLRTHNLSAKLAAQETAAAQISAELRGILEYFGKVNVLAADPSAEATALWMNLGRKEASSSVQSAAAADKTAAPVTTVQAPILNAAFDPASLQVASVNVPAAGGIETAEQTAAVKTSSVLAQASARLQGAGVKQSSVQFLARNKNFTADAGQVLNSGVPVAALFKGAKKVGGAIKNFFAKKPAAVRPEAAPLIPGEGRLGTFQRASLYIASFVMGLEVATPVIANFGTSFGLSLQDNILVAAATYLPYSVGAFLSNYLKTKIGRKQSMNLGLGLMAAGFTTGVTAFGLNGGFVPQPDAMAHFYNILGCILVASTGGVFVHNAVGPMMTDLSAGVSDLSRQRRNANTELSRALGMASSFAFPALAVSTGADWSLTFAMPIPFIAAAALGINAARIPNTKPELDAAPALPQAGKDGIRARRAYQLASSFQNNSYVRLIKEEKGIVALLTGLLIMNAVEMSFSNGFLFLLPSLTKDPASQYLFGMMQFAAPFLLGRYLSKSFLKWFPKNNMSVATWLSAVGGLAALPVAQDNVYLLTAALFAAEVGISTAFTLAFARTARNSRTQDRIISLIVASAVSCAFGPMLLTNLAQTFTNAGLFMGNAATSAAMIGVPVALSALAALLFRRVERFQAAEAEGAADTVTETVQAENSSWLKRLLGRIRGNRSGEVQN